VEVKIGDVHSPRELTVETPLSAEEIEAAESKALADGSVLALADDRGRRLLVPVEKLSYIEIGESETRRVGFGAL
jgi:hypothetical protein